MKTIHKIIGALSVVLILSTAVTAQNLSDAQKAIGGEQYQKAKTILKRLAVAEPGKDENYFYLGWVYLLQDDADSAKTVFSRGVSVNPKSALNYAGLGAVAKSENNLSAMTTNFDQALALAGKSDKPYIYVAKAAIMRPANADFALAVLEKATKYGVKDPDYFVTMGDANHAKLDNKKAYGNYADAQMLDPKSPAVNVAIGIVWKQAQNYEQATQKFNDALAIDPNYGPAYRELAETDLSWAKRYMKVASVKVKEGTAYYRKYLSLTDTSPESEMRYADFLIESGDYKTLEQVANDLAKSDKSNLRIYRYLAYAAYENNNYPAGLQAINKFIKEAAPKRVIPRDYLYLGRLQIKSNQDSLGILNLAKAAQLDSTFADAYSEIAGILYGQKKYAAAGDAYQKYIERSHHGRLNDYFREGMSYYYGYTDQYDKTFENKSAPKPDSTLLTKADSAFSYVQSKTLAKPVADVILYRARVKDMEDADRANMKALAKPFYEQYIALKTATPPTDDRTKKSLGEAYAYLGSYYQLIGKNDLQASENYEKARSYYPENREAKIYFDSKERLATKDK